jgi:PKD repeat protein
VTHGYGVAGSYKITLTVTDNGGLTASASHTVQVNEPTPINRPPTAVISGPGQGMVGETLSFDGSASSDSDGSITSYAWSFGDGSTDTGAKVTHGYGVAGSYKITLTVTDNGGLTASASHTVQVNEPTPINRPPTAVISAPITGVLSQTIQFDASRSRDSDGSIVSYDWDFGDESAGKGITATHVYTQAGSYQVVLTVTDDGGLAAIAKHVIQISKEGIPSEAGIQAQSRVFEAGSQPLTELRRLTLGTQR